MYRRKKEERYPIPWWSALSPTGLAYIYAMQEASIADKISKARRREAEDRQEVYYLAHYLTWTENSLAVYNERVRGIHKRLREKLNDRASRS